MASLYKSPGVHIESAGDRYIQLERVQTGVPVIIGLAQKGPFNDPVCVGTFEQYARVFGDDQSHLAQGVRGFFDNGGKKAFVLNVRPESGLDPTPDDYIGALGTANRGLRLAERLEGADLVICPDMVGQLRRSIGFPTLDQVLAVQRAMVDHCERMRDRFAILDTPDGFKVDDVIKWRRHFDTSHAALFYPWIKVRIGDKVGPPIPPSGHLAGLFAATDQVEGVHRAPANIPLEGLVDVGLRIKKRDRDFLFDHGVNTLVAFPARGMRAWGGRTMSSDTSWKQINVRRLFITIRKSIELYSQWVVFEPNEPGLWKRLVRTIEVFLRDFWKQGALLGQDQGEAFYVKCDEETNPPEARDAGMLVCEIGIAPTRPAEYLIVRIQQFTRERTDEAKEEAPASEAAAAV
jgi:phage tail sheath protein FI